MASAGDGRGIVVRTDARALMGAYRPTVWVVLQDVVLDADWRDGRLVAATSARQVAEHLRLDPGTVAGALRVLRDAGVVELAQSPGPAGRFGLSAYTVHLPHGVESLTPAPRLSCAAEPHTDDPHTAPADLEAGLVLVCPWDRPVDSPPGAVEPAGGDARPVSGPSRRVRRSAAKRQGEQGAFDLGADL